MPTEHLVHDVAAEHVAQRRRGAALQQQRCGALEAQEELELKSGVSEERQKKTKGQMFRNSDVCMKQSDVRVKTEGM